MRWPFGPPHLTFRCWKISRAMARTIVMPTYLPLILQTWASSSAWWAGFLFASVKDVFKQGVPNIVVLVIFCTGGRHQPMTCAELVGRFLATQGIDQQTVHFYQPTWGCLCSICEHWAWEKPTTSLCPKSATRICKLMPVLALLIALPLLHSCPSHVDAAMLCNPWQGHGDKEGRGSQNPRFATEVVLTRQGQQTEELSTSLCKSNSIWKWSTNIAPNPPGNLGPIVPPTARASNCESILMEDSRLRSIQDLQAPQKIGLLNKMAPPPRQNFPRAKTKRRAKSTHSGNTDGETPPRCW